MVDDRSQDVIKLIEAGRDREAARRGAAACVAVTANQHDNGGTVDPLTQFSMLGPALGGVVAGIEPHQLDLPTPCADFTVRGVLEHMIQGATAFAAAYRGTAPVEPEVDDVLAGFGPALDELGAAVSSPGALDKTVAAPFGEVPGEAFARFIVLDGLVHGWDLATATGQPYDPPEELVSVVDAFARQAVDGLRGDAFGDAVEVPADAAPIERLVAFTGRRP